MKRLLVWRYRRKFKRYTYLINQAQREEGRVTSEYEKEFQRIKEWLNLHWAKLPGLENYCKYRDGNWLVNPLIYVLDNIPSLGVFRSLQFNYEFGMFHQRYLDRAENALARYAGSGEWKLHRRLWKAYLEWPLRRRILFTIITIISIVGSLASILSYWGDDILQWFEKFKQLLAK